MGDLIQSPLDIFLGAHLDVPNYALESSQHSQASEAKPAAFAFAGLEPTKATRRRNSNTSAPGRLEPSTFLHKRQRLSPGREEKQAIVFRKERHPESNSPNETRESKHKRPRVEDEEQEGEENVLSNQTPAVAQKLRIWRACVACRMRKTHCSGASSSNGCLSCSRRGTKCTPFSSSMRPRSSQTMDLSYAKTEGPSHSNIWSPSGLPSNPATPLSMPPPDLSAVFSWRRYVALSDAELSPSREETSPSDIWRRYRLASEASPLGHHSTQHPGSSRNSADIPTQESYLDSPALTYLEAARDGLASDIRYGTRHMVASDVFPAFEITSETRLDSVVAYFRLNSSLRDFTTELEHADCSRYPIATGGLADIYRATLSDGAIVAIKQMRSNFVSEGKATKRTARELHTWSKLRHTNILDILGLAVFRNDKLAMISPWMRNGNVMQYIARHPGLDKYSMVAQVAEAVVYLHVMNVVHGDLKGDNILVADNGTLKLTDFGLTMMHEQIVRFSTTDAGGGTYRWMAPELMQGESARSKETDMYALGMTMLVCYFHSVAGILYHFDLNVAYIIAPSAYSCLALCVSPVPLRQDVAGQGTKTHWRRLTETPERGL